MLLVNVSDIALNKPSDQSSNWAHTLKSPKAVDGTLSTWSSTLYQEKPWFKLNLENIYAIQFVAMAGGDFRKETYLSIGNNDVSGDKNKYCTKLVQLEERAMRVYECENGILEGQFLFIYGTTTNTHRIYLYDLKVYIL